MMKTPPYLPWYLDTCNDSEIIVKDAVGHTVHYEDLGFPSEWSGSRIAEAIQEARANALAMVAWSEQTRRAADSVPEFNEEQSALPVIPKEVSGKHEEWRARCEPPLTDYAVLRVAVHPIPEKEAAAETLRLAPTEAQRLMDDLWHCGLRPSEGKGSAGAMAATEKHLEDMRSLVRKAYLEGR